GMIQGLGMAVFGQKLIYDGCVTTLRLGGYKNPNVKNAPARTTTFVARAPHGPGPFHTQPTAEHAITPPPPATRNAAFKATRVRRTSLPISSVQVYQGLRSV